MNPKGAGSRVAVWAVGLIALGVVVRAARWGCRFPFWLDEASVALNLVDRGWSGIAAPLGYGQLMPIGFLGGEIFLYETLGPDELSLRLLPLLAGLASLFCFWKLTRVVMRQLTFDHPFVELLPLSLFAVSHFLVRYAVELKPYSGDVFFACLFLWLGAAAIVGNAQGLERRLVAPAILVGPATWFSYPVIFVGAALSLALLPSVARSRTARPWLVFIGFNVALLAGFASHYVYFGIGQSAAAGASSLDRFWAHAFPPADFVSLGVWLTRQHTGLMFAYPNGGANGGSTATLLFFLIGVWSLARGNISRPGLPRLQVVMLLLTPFLLNLAAATFHLYPYGGHPRLALFHAPAICLMCGVGLASAIDRIGGRRWQHRIICAVVAACVVFGVVGMGRNLVKPYRKEKYVAPRRFAVECIEAIPEAAPILFLNGFDAFDGLPGSSRTFQWYMRRFAGRRLVVARGFEDVSLAPGNPVAAVLYSGMDPEAYDERLEAWLSQVGDVLSLRGVTRRCDGESCERAVRLLVGRVSTPTVPSQRID